jgi:hypothetical protein
MPTRLPPQSTLRNRKSEIQSEEQRHQHVEFPRNKKTLAEKADAEEDSPKCDGKSKTISKDKSSEKSGADGYFPERRCRSTRDTSKSKGGNK